jgi:hypothetical protein
VKGEDCAGPGVGGREADHGDLLAIGREQDHLDRAGIENRRLGQGKQQIDVGQQPLQCPGDILPLLDLQGLNLQLPGPGGSGSIAAQRVGRGIPPTWGDRRVSCRQPVARMRSAAARSREVAWGQGAPPALGRPWRRRRQGNPACCLQASPVSPCHGG